MSVNGATAFVADAGDWNPTNREVRCAHTFDLAAVGCRIAETDYVAHGLAILLRYVIFVDIAVCNGNVSKCGGRRVAMRNQLPHRGRTVGWLFPL